LLKPLILNLLSDADENPELQAAQQQMQAMAEEMEQMHAG